MPADRDHDRSTGLEFPLQRTRPIVARPQIPVVLENLEVKLAQVRRQPLHRRQIAPVVAQEDVVLPGPVGCGHGSKARQIRHVLDVRQISQEVGIVPKIDLQRLQIGSKLLSFRRV